MSKILPIVLTGGPGGGKTTLIDELAHDRAWNDRFVALPESVFLMRDLHIDPHEKLFQRAMVHIQMALEVGLMRALDPDHCRLILCHRGSLDPLAYWLERGWPEDEFFAFTQTTRDEHYQRYAAVIHLVTVAEGAPEYYKRWPDAHRPETPMQAVHLDRLLGQVWGDHPHYFRLDNAGMDWPAKSAEAQDILKKFSILDGRKI